MSHLGFTIFLLELIISVTSGAKQAIPTSEDGIINVETVTADNTVALIPKIKQSEETDDIMEVLSSDTMVTIDIGQHLRVVEGVSITIRCEATGKPRPRIIWELNRKRIRDNLILQTSDSLVIIKFQKHHSGYYTCIAQNIHGQATAYSNVHENLAPPSILSDDGNYMVTEPKNVTITVGDRLSAIKHMKITIKCPFIGFPYPRATWFFNDQVIDHVKVANLDIAEPDGVSMLTIRSLEEEYAGAYMCTVFNVYGRMSKTATVRLITPWQPTIFSKRLEEKYDSFEQFVNISVGSNLTVFDDTDVNIYCDVRSSGNTTTYPITWSRKVKSKAVRILPPGKQLLIKDIKKADAGIYRCSVNDGLLNGDAVSSWINVIQKISPSIAAGNRSVRYVKGWNAALVVIGENLLVRAGLDVKLSCPYKAFPAGEITWQRNGMTLSLPEKTLNMMSTGDTLVIRDIKESDEDVYSCIVKSKIGSTRASSTFNVIPENSRPPRIPKSLVRVKEVFNQDSMVTVDVGTSIKIVEGAAVTIMCRGHGIPKPKITWELNQKPVKDDYILQTDDSLVFVKFHSYHSGYYKCQAENVMGKTRAFSDVRTQVPTELKILSSSGTFQITEESSLVKITIGERIKTTGGRNITILCPTEGTPRPKVLWKYNGRMIELGKRINMNRENAITIPDVKRWDSGVYTCYAGNSFEVVSSSSHLEILPEGSPVIIVNRKVQKVVSGPALVDIEIGTNLTTITGKSLRILCPAVGGEKLFYDWTIDGKPLHYDTRMSLQIPNQLIIRDLQFFDNGQFTCRVYNKFGSDTMSSLLTLIDDGSVVGTNRNAKPGVEPMKRITIGTNIVITKGKSFELICPTRGGKRPQLVWTKDNVPIVPSNYLVPRGEVLLLQYVQPNMNGYYSCTLITEFGSSVATSHVKINDLIPVKILKRSGRQQAYNPADHLKATIGHSVYAVNGVAITLQCPHVSSPPAKITWLFNKTNVLHDDDYIISKDSLIIPKMDESYSGRYTCVAKQPDRTRTAYSRIYLLSMKKPTISCSAGKLYTKPSLNNIIHISIGDDIVANMHKNIFIHCPPFIGIPKPKVVWKHNGKPIKDLVGLHDWKNGSIELMSVVWEHTGTFECHQINPIGLDSCSTEVKVYGKNTPTTFQVETKTLQIKGSMKKTYTVSIGDIVTVREGTSLLLKCPVNKYGPVDIAWEKDGKAVKKIRRKHGSIMFRRIRVEDSGDYTCISHDQAAVKFGTVSLNVIVSLKNLLMKPKSTQLADDIATLQRNIEMDVGKNVTVFVGSTIKFLCQLKSEKDVDITWLKDGEEITDQPNYAKDLNFLYVRDTEVPDTYKITCVVSGVLDNAHISSFVEVQGKTLVKINSRSGTIRATDPSKQLSTIIGKHIFAVAGITIRIRCPHVGYPKPEIKWMINKTMIVNNSSYAFDGDALVIPKMVPRAAGTYKCIATQEDYKTSAITRVIYRAMRKPTITKSKRALYSMITSEDPIFMTIGDSLRSNLYKKVYIVCPVNALPKASVIWKFKGKPISTVRNAEVFKENGTLVLTSILWDHDGTFECFQANPVGIDSAYSQIKVVGKFTPTRYVARMNYTDAFKLHGKTGSVSIGSHVIIKEGATLQFKCPVSRFGPVYVSWKREEGGFQRTGSSKDGSFLMKNIKISNSGTYVCYSSDPAKIVFGSIKVKVLRLLKKLIQPPPKKMVEYIVGPFKQIDVTVGTDVRVLSGNKVKITCELKDTKSDVNITWLLNEKAVPRSRMISIKDNTFLIKATPKASRFRVSCVFTGVLESTSVTSNVEIVGLVPVQIKHARGILNATLASTNIVATIGQTIRAIHGATITIRCPHVAQPKGRVIWLVNTTVINNSTQYLHDKASDAIVIPKMTIAYAGRYTCNVIGVKSKAKASSYVALLSTRKPHMMKSRYTVSTMPNSEDTVYLTVGDTLISNIGKRIMIDCPRTGLPPAHVDWKYNNKPLSKSADMMMLQNGTLFIKSLTWKHKGKYICFQTNPAGLDWSSTDIKVVGRYTPTSFKVQKNSMRVLELKPSTIKVPIGTDIMIAERNSLVLECSVPTFGPVDIVWEKDGRRYNKGARRDIFLNKLRKTDSGNYSCFTKDPAKVLFGSVKVEVIVSLKDLIIKPKMKDVKFTKFTSKQVNIDIGTNIQVLSGNVISIKCPLNAKNGVDISWLLNSKRMFSDPTYSFQGDTLLIKDTSQAGIYYYSCVAKSLLGNTKLTSKVEVIALQKPKIVKSNQIVFTDPRGDLKWHINIGDNIVANLMKVVTIHCDSNGVPKPNILWKFNGRPISEMSNLVNIKNGSMVINRVMWDNQGVYECYQINTAGLDTAFTKVKVYGRYTPTKFKVPKTTLNLMDTREKSVDAPIGSNVTIGESKNVKLRCQVSRYGKLDTTWMKDGKILEGASRDRRGNTILFNVRIKDSGTYECFSNDKAKVKFGSVNLKVLVPLDQLIIRPSAKTVEHLKLSKKRVTLNVDVGTSVQMLANNDLQFMCHLKSDDDVKVVWLRDGKKITGRGGYSIQYNKLTIRNTAKAQSYTISCVVSRPTIQKDTARIASSVKIVGSKAVEIRSKFGTIRATSTQRSLKAVIGNIVYALPGIPIEIQCPHVAVPKASITWLFKGRNIKGSPYYMIGKVNDALFIPKMAPRFAGKYSCVAQQGKVKVKADSIVQLADMQKPIVAKSNRKRFTVPTYKQMNHMIIGDGMIANLNQNVMIDCPVSGIPSPKTFWKFNNKPVTTMRRSNIEVQKNSSLLIRNILWKNQGVYECSASNLAGLDSAISKIMIIGRYSPANLQLKQQELKILNLVRNQKIIVSIGSSITIRESNSLFLNCPVFTYGSVPVQWEKDGKIFSGNLLPMGTILLRNLKPEDSGEYVCYSNDQAKMKFGAVTVRVVEHVNDILSKLKVARMEEDGKRQRQAIVGNNATLFTGKTFKLTCPVKSSKDIKITWLLNGRQIRKSNKRFLIDDNVMIILDTSKRSSYDISCVVTGILGQAKITSRLNVVNYERVKIKRASKLIRVTSPSRNVRAIIGNNINTIPGITIQIKCPHTGYPKPEITWLFNGAVITEKFTLPLGLIGNALVIPRMSKDYIGRYTCLLTQRDDIREAESSVNLLTMKKPKIRVSSHKLSSKVHTRMKISMVIGDALKANLKKQISISCPTSGIPDPKILWKLNGKPIDNIEGISTSANGDLFIQSLQWKHNGTYECNALNYVGADIALSNIIVYGENAPTQYKPQSAKVRVLRLIRRPYAVNIGTNLTIRSENDLLLGCPVGNRRLKYFWMKDDKPFYRSPRDVNQQLALSKVKKSDSGRYTCVSNDPARIKFGTVTLTVLEPMENLFLESTAVPKTRAVIMSAGEVNANVGEYVQAISGSVVKLKCNFKSAGKVSISWMKDNRQISSRSIGHTESGNVLTIKDTQRPGNRTYTCLLTGLLGKAKKSSTVEVIEYIPVKINGQSKNVRFTDPSKIGVAVIGSNIMTIPGVSFRLRCPYVGMPKPEIGWYFNRTKIERSIKVGMVKDNIIIPKMSGEYAGKYTCVALQGTRRVFKNSNVKMMVMSKPYIIKVNQTIYSHPKSRAVLHVGIGSTAKVNLYKKLMLHCDGGGVPTPKTVWKFNGKPISDIKSIFEKNNGSLMIPSISWMHKGTYECYKINPAGLDSGITKVIVFNRNAPTNHIPAKIIIRALKSGQKATAIIGATVIIRASNSLTLKCPVQYFGQVDVAWVKNGQVISNNGRVHTIDSVDSRDAGRYDCVSNDVGNEKFGSVILKVLEPMQDLIITPQKKYTSFSREDGDDAEASIGTNVAIVTGNPIKLRCLLKYRDNVNITWFVDGHKIWTGKKYSVDGNILYVKSNHNGGKFNVTCRASSLLGSTQMSSMLEIAEYIPVKVDSGSGNVKRLTNPAVTVRVSIGNNILAIPGIRIKLACPFIGKPRPTIEWFENRTKIHENEKYSIGMENNELIIPKMSKDYVARYTCVASQGRKRSTGSTDIRLLVMTKPIIFKSNETIYTKPIPDYIVYMKIGDSLRINLYKRLMIHCGSTGIPTPKTVWKFNGRSIDRVENVKASRNGSLMITSITWNHQGTFECFRINPAGLDTATSKVKIYGQFAPTNYVPKKGIIKSLRLHREPVTANIGTTVVIRAMNSIVLKCPVTFYGSVNIAWYKDGKVVKNNQPFVDSLMITKLSGKDSGEYVCRSNDLAKIKFGAVSVKVLEPVQTQIIEPAKKTLTFSQLFKEPVEATVGTNIAITTGNRINLKCMVKDDDNVDITWLVDGEKITNGELYQQKGSVLQFRNTASGGKFNVTCKISSMLGAAHISSILEVVDFIPAEVKTASGTIRFTDPAKMAIASIGHKVLAVDGVSLKLTCPYIGIPKPEIAWYFNRSKIERDEKFPIGKDSDDLIIPKMSKDYAGTYTCVALQALRKTYGTSLVKLLVMERPRIAKSNRKLYGEPVKDNKILVNIGDTVTVNLYKKLEINCISTGIPKPKTVWKFNGKPISGVENVLESKNGTLMITSITWMHQGSIECFKINPAGLDTATSKVNVYGQYSPTNNIAPNKTVEVLDSRKDAIISPIGTTLIIRAMNSVILTCPVLYYGKVDIVWFKNGKMIRDERQFNDMLRIAKLGTKDSGDYVCYSNDLAKVKFGTVTIKVIEPVEDLIIRPQTKSVTFPQFTKEEVEAAVGTNVAIITGNKIRLRCLLKFHDNIKIKWLVNGEFITSNRDYTINDNVLHVKNTFIGGSHNITCHVSSLLGSTQVSSMLEVVDYIPVKVLGKMGKLTFTDPLVTGKVIVGMNVMAVPGISIKVSCPYSGTPKPAITWYVNRTKIDQYEKYPIGRGSDDLVIPRMSADYVGKYTCVASQGKKKSSGSSIIRLLVMSQPTIFKTNKTHYSQPMPDNTVHINIGDSVTINLYKQLVIHCRSKGLPTPKTVWKFNGRPIKEVENVFESNNGSMMITSVSWAHQGSFECFKINPAGLDSASSKVQVYGQYTPTNYVPTKRRFKVLKITRKVLAIPLGTNLIVRAQNSVVLKCPVQSYGIVDLGWYKDGKLVDHPGKFRDMLKLSKVNGTDSGTYVCVSRDLAKVKFGNVILHVLEPVKDLIIRPQLKSISFLQPSSVQAEAAVGTDVKIVTGNGVKLRCLLKSQENINITWKLDGRPISSGGLFKIDGNVLLMKNTIGGGIFNVTCQISSLLGSQQISSKVEVVVPTKLYMHEKEQNVVSSKLQEEFEVGGTVQIRHGSSVDIKCPVTGIPPPRIEWWFDNRRITKENNELQFNFIGTNKILSIPFADQMHSGMYKCIAKGVSGETVEASMDVYVYEPLGARITVQGNQEDGYGGILGRNSIYLPSSSSSPVVWIEAGKGEPITEEVGQDYKLLSGLLLNLTCPSDGRPKPSIIWKKDGSNIAANTEYYVIDTKQINSSGIYSCTAYNVFGTVTKSSNVDAIVPSKPIIQREPVMTNKTEYVAHMDGATKVEVFIGDNLETISGTAVSIRCPAIGVPRPKITYYKDGKLIKPSKHIKIDSLGSLLLVPATIGNSSNGVYTCRAQNEAGYEELHTRLDLYSPLKPEFLPPKTGVLYDYKPRTNEGKLVLSVGQNAVAYPNTQVILKCPVAGFPFPVIIWEKDDQILSESPAGVSKAEATNLNYKLKAGGGGDFYCTATNMAGSVRKKATIEIREPSPARIESSKSDVINGNTMSETITIGSNANLLVNSSLKLYCPSTGEPEPKIRWSKDDKPFSWLQKQKGISVGKSGHQLSIKHMIKDLSGVYTCTATNIFGKDLRRSSLAVKDIYPPRITNATKKVVAQRNVQEITSLVGGELFVRPNTRVLIQCLVSGSPPPTVRWAKDGKDLNMNIDEDTNTLTLPGVGLKHEGTYTCFAKNFLSTVSASTKLYIGMRPTIPHVQPLLSPIVSTAAYSEVTIPIGVQDAFVRSGSTAAFQCNGKGYPVPVISWFRNGVRIDYNKGYKKYQSLIPSVLEVKKLTSEDAGVYSCMVNNVFGMTIKRTKLEILEPPVIQKTKSNITFNPSTDHVRISVGGGIIVLKGASVSLRCPATGKPKPEIHWSKRNTTFFVDRRFSLTADKQLIIKNIQLPDSGKYICTARNKVASASSFVRLLVADKPNAVILPNYRSKGRGRSAGVLDTKGRLIVPSGSPIRLFCRMTGSPTPRITWLKDHTIVRASEKYQVSKGLLEVNFANASDAGTYVCMVENLLGVTTIPIEVLIGAAPQISKVRFSRKSNKGSLIEASVGSDINVYSASTVKIYCNATGIPKPIITWERDEGDPRRGIIRSQSAETGVLILNDIAPETAGNISCVAKNVIGMDKVVSSISIMDPPKIISDVKVSSLGDERYMLMGRDKVVNIIEGESLKLVCVSQGSPYPNIYFSHPRQKLSGEEMFDMLQNLEGNAAGTVEEVLFSHTRQLKQSLKFQQVTRFGQRLIAMVAIATINNIKLLHKGVYSCKAKNNAGSDEEKISFIVHPKPKLPHTGTWVVSDYGICDTPCVRVDYGAQNRNVSCLTYGGKITHGAFCGVHLKPKESRECPTMQCTTIWQTGMWSECSASCGENGVQERIPYCIYSKWKVQTDSSNCASLKDKPTTKRKCNQYPCSEDKCVDTYQYCKFMKKMGFCRMQKYKTLCCASCIGGNVTGT